MCYIKAPGVEDGKSAVRPLLPESMATACEDQAGPQLSAIDPQLTIIVTTNHPRTPRPHSFAPIISRSASGRSRSSPRAARACLRRCGPSSVRPLPFTLRRRGGPRRGQRAAEKPPRRHRRPGRGSDACGRRSSSQRLGRSDDRIWKRFQMPGCSLPQRPGRSAPPTLLAIADEVIERCLRARRCSP
jgi:hypothetical protein